MNRKYNWNEFKAVLSNNKINKLYHFTDRANLPNIIKSGGLLSWKDCQNKGVNIPKPGGGGPGSLSWQLDERSGLQNYVRVSFTKQHPMMYAALNEGRISDCVILEIDPEVIFWEGTKYADMNATKTGANIGDKISDFKKIHFSTVKEINHFVLLSEEQPYYQAEILVKNSIPLSYIKNIGDFGIPLQLSTGGSYDRTQSEATPKMPESPAEIVSALWQQGRFAEAISIASSGFVPSSNSTINIENYIDKYKNSSQYQREVIINTRTFRYIHNNGSSLTVVGNKGKYYVTVSDGIYNASHAYPEKEFDNLLSRKRFPSELIKEIGFLCQQSYEERMSMGCMIQVLAHAEPISDKFKRSVESVMKGYLYLPDDFDTQICFFTTQQIDNIISNLTVEKKRFLFVIMSKLNMASIENYQSGDILNVLSSKRFQILANITKKYNLPQSLK